MAAKRNRINTLETLLEPEQEANRAATGLSLSFFFTWSVYCATVQNSSQAFSISFRMTNFSIENCKFQKTCFPSFLPWFPQYREICNSTSDSRLSQGNALLLCIRSFAPLILHLITLQHGSPKNNIKGVQTLYPHNKSFNHILKSSVLQQSTSCLTTFVFTPFLHFPQASSPNLLSTKRTEPPEQNQGNFRF